ncbi:glucose-1-phosphate cytidylyltransferase [Chloracidobacterium validum]|uniref:Glucose-1-phosphate cytidylyltransferase n=1 Tax=Chloracidobacterium validum TaxID=2821543 RepID=A0ABX8BEK8_9BACT|nr:glucose-1-phosphate cytidylyltransferase [Chloracidobacterium validum]QUW04330.1 glucose-1-phosphate cytidylyltransferase [Chloracidobacterium validum]
MKVAILCGGRGTRLREVSETIPKPMVPVGEHPILWHVMKLYAAHGFTDFVLLLGYKGVVIREYFLNFAAYEADVTVDLSATGDRRLTFHGLPSEPWRVTLVNTGEDTLTGGRVRRARRYLETDELFCLTYGDGVGDIDLTGLLAFHRAHGRLATVTAVRPPGRFGELALDDARCVRVFNEKPQVSGGYINGGFFIFHRDVIERYFPDRDDLMLEKEPLEALARDGQLMAFQHDGFWQPMDTPREFQLLNDLWRSGRAPWKIW